VLMKQGQRAYGHMVRKVLHDALRSGGRNRALAAAEMRAVAQGWRRHITSPAHGRRTLGLGEMGAGAPRE